MAYRALYREYRPARFCEVVGQEHITTTLQNQIMTEHIAHAYLFCGTRGTGKTSTAKIFARAVNCLTPENGEPCGKCAACLAAESPANADITEIDAASNNGVDNVRDLIERVQYMPMQLSRRVFIIDEVHMMSGPAFNALLKTLEEPPAHVVFILATTEPQKLPATIISRCQRYDFDRLSVKDIVGNLRSVLSRAGASVDEAGLLLIARAADGGMRDALSLADQCLAFCGDRVSEKDVYDVLGSMEQGFLFDFADALLASDAARSLRLLDDIVRGGRNLTVFCNDLSAHFRALLLAKTCGRCEDLLDCTDDAMARYLKQAENCSHARLLLSLQTLLAVQGDMRYLPSPRTALESALVAVCRPEESSTLLALEARLDRLERDGVTIASARITPAVPESPPIAPPLEVPRTEAPTPNKPGVPAVQQPGPTVREAAPRETPHTDTPARAPKTAADWTANALWGAILTELKKQNVLVHAVASAGAADNYVDNILTVVFPEARSAQFNSVCAPINRNKLQAIAGSIAPGTTITFTKGTVAPVSEETIARAKEIFGDKLIIE